MLGLTQSAVSHAIKQMEENLDITLLDRTMRPVVPTAAGNLLLRYAGHLLSEADRVLAAMRATEKGVVPMIRLGMVDSFATAVGARLIKRLKKISSEVSVLSGQSPTLRTLLLNRQLDLVIGSDEFADSNGFEQHVVLREPFVIILPKAIAAKRHNTSLSELAASMPFVRPSPQSATGRAIAAHFRRLRIEVSSAVEFNNPDAIITMVAENIGWAITTPLCLLHNKQLRSKLIVLPLHAPGLSRQLAVIGRHGEFGNVTFQVAELARSMLRKSCYTELCRLAPFQANEITIGDVMSTGAMTTRLTASDSRKARSMRTIHRTRPTRKALRRWL
jgi:DNA-binding transcriptional LysR family regulator